MVTGESLALTNAILNFCAAVCLAGGFAAIKRKNKATHQRFMVTAFAFSCLFLISYLTRRFVFGDKPFEGQGLIRPVYFAILISHVSLAIVVVPLVLRTLWLASRAEFKRHRRLARWTFPIWAYVSVTGVVVYIMLYQM